MTADDGGVMAKAVFPWETAKSGKRLGRAVVVPKDAMVPFPVAQQIRWLPDADRAVRRTKGYTRGSHYEWARRCPACGRVRVFLAHQKTCSKPCGMVSATFRSSQVLALERRLPRMVAKAKAAKRAAAEARLAREVVGLTPEQAYRKAYRRGYSAGHQAGSRRQLPLDPAHLTREAS
jgi:hypothetical protein